MTEFTPPTHLLLGDLEAVIRDHARANKRSQQTAVGPSELGQQCERRLALTLLGAPKTNDDRDEWTSSVGTACHTWMEQACIDANTRLTAAGLPARWLVEATVTIEPGLQGHTDAYDLWTHTVCDWKFPGATSMRKYRKAGNPGQQYTWQAHTYGLGWAKLGFPVREVAICMFPRSGLIRDSWLWHEPYNEAIARQALKRKDDLLVGMDIAEGLDGLPEFMQTLRRDTEHCAWCPFYNGGPHAAEDPTAGCGGPFEDPDYASRTATIVEGIL